MTQTAARPRADLERDIANVQRGRGKIAYCAAAHGSPDLTIAPESDPAVVNGLLGKLLVEYWWPDPETPAGTRPTPYAAAYGIQAG